MDLLRDYLTFKPFHQHNQFIQLNLLVLVSLSFSSKVDVRIQFCNNLHKGKMQPSSPSLQPQCIQRP